MNYPKQLMTIKELIPMGFSDCELRKIARQAGYPVVIRDCGKTSTLKFDTEELQKYLARQTKMWLNAHR